jgi:ferric-dicitrate binding protein FerR (iron transport regulator)
MSLSKLEFRTFVASRTYGGITRLQHPAFGQWSHEAKRDRRALGVCAFVAVALAGPTALPDLSGAFPWEALDVPTGSVGHFVLGDGRRASLNTGSEAQVLTTPTDTYLVLHRGEALIEGESSRKLHLISNGASITATQAEFSVRRRDATRSDVVVGKGTVEIGRPDALITGWAKSLVTLARPARLMAGETASASQDGLSARRTLSPEVVAHKLAWKDGWLWFNDDSLPEVVERFNSYSDKRLLVVADRRLFDLTLGGRFRASEADVFVATLSRVFGVQAQSVHSASGDSQVVYLTLDCKQKILRCSTPMVQ